jgi:hypothetical protein
MLEVLFAVVHQLRFIKVLDWVSVPITIKHSDVGGCSAMERVVRAFVKTKDMVVNLKTEKRPARSVASICKDRHYGFEVPLQESRRRLRPLSHEISKGVYHVDGLHPGDEPKASLFVLRSCRSKSGWCKRQLQASEVHSMYDISDSITNGLTDELRSKIIKLDYLSPLIFLLGAAHAVLREVPGEGLIPERSVKMRRDAAAEVLSSTVLPGDKAKLGLVGKEVMEQEESIKHDDDVIPYHLWDSRLTRLWGGEVLPPSDVVKAAEVI